MQGLCRDDPHQADERENDEKEYQQHRGDRGDRAPPAKPTRQSLKQRIGQPAKNGGEEHGHQKTLDHRIENEGYKQRQRQEKELGTLLLIVH